MSASGSTDLTILHNRTAFEDADEPALKRHLLRLWLVAHEPRRPVDEAMRAWLNERPAPRLKT